MSPSPAKTPLSLPQPSAVHVAPPYTYILYDEIESTYFPSAFLAEGTLCWVLKSKGAGSDELFLRARVVREVNNGRVLVRYPKGSEYRVRRCNLRPVLEKHSNIVVIVPETPQYRRACVVHTCVGESFLEIGCDFGPTVDRVRKALTEVGAVPHNAGEVVNEIVVPPDRVLCLGIDKSPDSLDIAMSRYPDCTFSLQDTLTKEGAANLRKLCKDKLVGACPSVVAVDINGNREIPAVLQCVDNLMNPGDDVVVGTDWELPRLIIVKSRLLHAEIKSRRGMAVT